jgi:sugar phosphate isomerase/epimerase
MLWGLHNGGWMSGLISGAEDRQRAHLELLRRYDLHVTAFGAGHLMEMEGGQREELAELARDCDVHIALGVRVDFLSEDADEIKRGTDQAIEAIDTLADMLRTPVCQTGLRRDLHHYSHDYPVAEQIDRLSVTMAPLAKACAGAGCPLVIHKVTHFGADLAELCSRVPGLGIQLDTANCFLIGEPPLVAAEACAPYTYAAHFKDHFAFPSFSPLGLKVRGAVCGEGDAALRETYDILMKKAPDPDNLVMELEIDPVRDENDQMRDQAEVLEESLAFVRSL